MKQVSTWRIWLIAGLLWSPHAGAIAQIAVNDTIRVRNAKSSEVTGTVTAIRRDSIAIRTRDSTEPVWLPRSADLSVEVARGVRTHALDGLFIGTGIGAVSGLALGAFGDDRHCATDSRGTSCGHIGREANTAIGLILLVPAGALIGAIAGGWVETPRWQQIAKDDLRVSVIPQGSDIKFRVSLNVP